MSKKTGRPPVSHTEHLHLATAVEQYVAQGGIINVVPEGECAVPCDPLQTAQDADPEALMCAKLDLLRGLVAKGAGVSALQYSLRMNRKEIKRLASENGLKIVHSRPVRRLRTPRKKEPAAVNDMTAGHAMHYSTLGYTVPEIAQLLDLSVRDVWNIGKAYRFEFKHDHKSTTPLETYPDITAADD